MGTVLLKNGRIVDGTGRPAFDGHLLIDGERIEAVFKKGEGLPPSEIDVDVNGCVISPGFIDMHSHSDWVLPLADHHEVLKCLVEQGITTVVAGNCGFSPAPVDAEGLSEEVIGAIRPLIDKPFAAEWQTMGEFLDNIERIRPVVNVAQLVGHATVRNASARTRRGLMKPDELRNCLDSARSALREGACGLSFGLGYDPGMYSPLEEIEAFSSVAGKEGKPVTVHLKALSKLSPTYPITYLKPHNLRALREMLGIARKTGIRLQVSHFIFAGRKSWPTAEAALRMVEVARSEGVDVMIDAFPFTFGNTTINIPLPYWFLARLPYGYRSGWARSRLRVELALGFRLLGFSFKDFQVMDAAVEGREDLNGLTLVEIARKWNMDPFDVLLGLSESSNGGALMLLHSYSGEPGKEDVLESVLSNSLCLFETDTVIKSSGYPNPAGLGTFPKILGNYVRDRKLFTLENAVRRMTSASADRFALKDRGELSPGKAADVVVFNPVTVSDMTPTGAEPAGRPKGIKHVFINGRQVLMDGSYVEGLKAGQVLRV